MITAPYNFVPLNKEVFYPSWANDVSHDIPFEDGESGEIDITITAKSPIFIRNHYQDTDEYYEIGKDKNKIKVSKEFCHFINENGAKEFYIPGSSFKGMVRSVLEIMTFSKIFIDEEKFKKPLSVRDMTPKQYCLDETVRKMKDCPPNKRANLFVSDMVATAQKCGFLRIKSDGTGDLLDCNQMISIHYDELKKFGIDGIKNLASAKQKYNHIKSQNLHLSIKVENKDRRQIALKGAGNKIGQLVLSGNIQGKKNEFIFIKNNRTIPLKKEVVDNFKKVYFLDEQSEDGQYWYNKYKANNSLEIPVFYIGNNQIQAIGLTQIFKLAYTKTIFDASKQDSNPHKLDFAQTIFGTENDKLALKGRVQFSHLKCTIERYEKQVDAILGSPNPTYYPNYIKQDGTNGKVSKYKTLMDNDAVISGWKRYPLHSQVMSSGENSDKEAVKTHFKPLESGTVFKGKLRFHNLKKCEIGALLSAITFHGQSDKCIHNIGMAKPLGYGKIDIKLTPKNLKYSQNEYLQEFEDEVSKVISNWKNSSQLKELFAMANINTKSNKDLQYQLLENPNPKYAKDKNDFTGAKKAREFLLPHSGTIIPEIKKTFTSSSEMKVQNQKSELKNTGLKIVKKIETSNTNQTHQTNQVKEYSIEEIAKEVGCKAQDVLDFIQNSTLSISKKLNLNSTLKEAQAKNLIKQMKSNK
ncbi:TIGR03986 family CRISPR-associated RAMP protein [Aliarcobacter cryaerophilus]|uniref:TIGR03986 family type III CRISPR-associated RAMP protein n=1 Tax=Aliarcobacter cryaerophilus TaxID=28198 RepID=UPI0021B537D8|nr:TIGR03986 family CRISPR-associated RAMP protein [Aliarcobacter cryaerophilus]MCT7529420.1 TIGR03986 family CRISPR-associated RAMP protein [Aliarcobacter cryaerophilus]